MKKTWMVFALLLALTAPTAAQDDPVRIIFMHHSTGQGLIEQGGVRPAFAELGYEFWDHGYNGDGLADPSGNYLGVNWDVPGDNTDQDGWREIFNQTVTDPPDNTFSHMLEFDVIIFKSCFPTSDIQSDEQFEAYRSYFLDMRDVMDQHPDKLFIPFTTPPLDPTSTSPEAAARARQWAEYLTSPEYLEGHPNIVVFDFFNLLADEDGYLRAEYRPGGGDSHPNELANQTIGPIFVEFVDQAIRQFVPGEPSLPEDESQDKVDSGEGESSEARNNLPKDFESGDASADWWIYINEEGSELTCANAQPGYESDVALQIDFKIVAGGSAGCGTDLITDESWADAEGITFFWRSDQPDITLNIYLGVLDPAQTTADTVGATPFETQRQTEGEEWTQVTIYWDDLYKPDWVGNEGVDEFDPSQVVWVGFDVGNWETAVEGTIWIDDIALLVGQ